MTYRINLKFKAPKAVSNPPITSLEELETDWTESRKRLRAFLDQYPEKWRNKAVYKHAILGRINLEDGLEFYSEHLGHHMRQLKRIESAL